MSSHEIITSIALKLHAFGLGRIHDPNWTGLVLFYYVKDHWKELEKPFDLLLKTHRQGLLYKIGLLLFREYFLEIEHPESLSVEYRYWYLADLVELLTASGANISECPLKRAIDLVAQIDSIDFSSDEPKYWRSLRNGKTISSIQSLIEGEGARLSALAPLYASVYAERVFHDRQLCEYIGRLLVTIGFDGSTFDDETPRQWMSRPKNWPTWVIGTVLSRDRGFCANCNVSITSELLAPRNIDHIVPLARGGTNDLCNLQLLCSRCNNRKRANCLDVRSSVPL